MASVLIVQNEEIVAEALAAYVRRIGGFAVAGAVWTGAEALRRLELERIDPGATGDLPVRHQWSRCSSGNAS